ncbi:hypothetical protein BU17DRAFT_75038 [Hysterangium stoloniferum]|nr:hypothetical protein BU17DRAFT_75038 [Hysterangium stoloniferum]
MDKQREPREGTGRMCERRKKRIKNCEISLTDIKKLLVYRHTKFEAGLHGLQAHRAQSIECYLQMSIDASKCAAESEGFAPHWGGRLVQSWICDWLEHPRHVKVASLLEDPNICAELRFYLRSNKWTINPEKLAEFINAKLLPTEAKKYLHRIVDKEMPRGLKKYVEVELFPRIQLSDETTMQSNDGPKASWVSNGEQPLKKKGAGRGLHESGIICSTVDNQDGKNYDGYWNSQLFVEQLVNKIIPTFEKVHGPGYQALIMVDHSQGHAAYPPDALRVSEMNLNPGGSQCQLRDGWFMCNGMKIIQPMIFAHDHPTNPKQPKGIKAMLQELKKYLRDNCDYTFDTLKENLPKALALASVDVRTIRKWEHHTISGKGTKEAQLHVKQFTSCKYTSHRRIPGSIASLMDD